MQPETGPSENRKGFLIRRTMDFDLTEEQHAIRDAMQGFAEREIVPRAAEFDITS